MTLMYAKGVRYYEDEPVADAGIEDLDIEAMEILQNYKTIEDISKPALAVYMKEFAQRYSDNAAVFVLENRKYKKSTIAFLERFLNYFGIENTMRRFLSTLSSYAIPEMEEFYEAARE